MVPLMCDTSPLITVAESSCKWQRECAEFFSVNTQWAQLSLAAQAAQQAAPSAPSARQSGWRSLVRYVALRCAAQRFSARVAWPCGSPEALAGRYSPSHHSDLPFVSSCVQVCVLCLHRINLPLKVATAERDGLPRTPGSLGHTRHLMPSATTILAAQ